ncbi:MAG: pilus assembly FimT family protein [Pseudomarimonas sp.]
MYPSGANAARQARGFTLVEIVVVIALIGLIFAVISVSIGTGLEGAKVRAASRDLAAALRYTRTQAIVKRESQALLLDVDARSYTAPGKPAVQLPRQMSMKMLTAASEQVDEGVGRIRFFADGSSTGGHIDLLREKAVWGIDIAWLTGEVTLREGNGDGAR